MLINSHNLENGSIHTVDICVIGAGPAGETLANEFLGTATTVALLESGGLKPNRRAQSLSSGAVSGALYELPEETQLRQVGGTANHWIIRMADDAFGYRFTPLSGHDFEARDYQDYSGWPVKAEDIEPYYGRVHDVLGIPNARYGFGEWSVSEPIQFDPELLQTDYFCFAPTSPFTKEFPRQFKKSKNIHLYINSTVVELELGEATNEISMVRVKNFVGVEFFIKATHFVIACGGYQTARLLLASNKVHKNGIGNEHDVVGRYLMDHSLVPSGNFYLNDPAVMDQLSLYDMRMREGVSVLGKISLTEACIKKYALRNITFSLFPMPRMKDVAALQAIRKIIVSFRARKIPKDFLQKLACIVLGARYLVSVLFQTVVYKAPLMPGFGQGGWSKVKGSGKRFDRLELLAFVEQSPNPNNRLTLIDECDELGMPKINAHFQWDKADLDSILKSQELVAQAFNETGMGKFVPDNNGEQPRIGSLGLHHILGTTRMGDDPRTSVVDKNCKVHGLVNLFIASSSIFATGGYANPTLTICAFAIRLADNLKQLLFVV